MTGEFVTGSGVRVSCEDGPSYPMDMVALYARWPDDFRMVRPMAGGLYEDLMRDEPWFDELLARWRDEWEYRQRITSLLNREVITAADMNSVVAEL